VFSACAQVCSFIDALEHDPLCAGEDIVAQTVQRTLKSLQKTALQTWLPGVFVRS